MSVLEPVPTIAPSATPPLRILINPTVIIRWISPENGGSLLHQVGPVRALTLMAAVAVDTVARLSTAWYVLAAPITVVNVSAQPLTAQRAAMAHFCTAIITHVAAKPNAPIVTLEIRRLTNVLFAMMASAICVAVRLTIASLASLDILQFQTAF